jgi:hypothetical protein
MVIVAAAMILGSRAITVAPRVMMSSPTYHRHHNQIMYTHTHVCVCMCVRVRHACSIQCTSSV